MTSKLTRARLEHYASLPTQPFDDGASVFMYEVRMMARMALAAMDSEPAIIVGDDGGDALAYRRLVQSFAPGTKLYRHAQPIVQPVMFIDGDISSESADKLAKVFREFNEEDERPLAKMARMIRENPHRTNECDMPKAQPASVVPDAIPVSRDIDAGYLSGWNACRAAMLNGGKS